MNLRCRDLSRAGEVLRSDAMTGRIRLVVLLADGAGGEYLAIPAQAHANIIHPGNFARWRATSGPPRSSDRTDLMPSPPTGLLDPINAFDRVDAWQ